ncbi:MAG: hypothetical protein V3S73_04560, partial [Gammaproteobacteria bacterium]
LALATTALAGEPENMPCQDTKIVLRLDLPWTKPERGNCWEWWTDNYRARNLYALWQGKLGKIVIRVSRLAPKVRWRGQLKLDRRSLENWPGLKDLGVSDIQKISCAVDKCVSFSAGKLKCGAFGYLTGSYGDHRKGDRGTDLVSGYYCSQSGEAFEKLDGILEAIDLEPEFPNK